MDDSAGKRERVSDTVAPEHPRADRAANVVVAAAPALIVLAAACLAWGHALHWQSLVVLVVMYALTGLGITVGFHRLFTHRSFRTGRAVRITLGVMGSAAIEGPLIEWVANHRRHHRFSDRSGDPHSPHAGHASGWRGAVRGLAHAHLGWVLSGSEVANPQRYAPDLLADPLVRMLDRMFLLWVAVGLALSFALGLALSGTVQGGLQGLLWGGAVRILLVHHATFSINSLCHYFGRCPYDTGEQSRNLAWLAVPTLGEAWHNNHHAFPTSARHGLRWWQLDPSAWVIACLARLGLASDVVRADPLARTPRKRRARAPG